MEENPQKKEANFQKRRSLLTIRSPIAIVSILSAIGSFVSVVFLSKDKLDLPQTFYAISMGLLGSSLYLIYNLIGVMREQRFDPEEIEKNISRLLVGPVAGWLVYFMVVTSGAGPENAELLSKGAVISNKVEKTVKMTDSTIQIWLPFLVGFSSDLMVGIINQMVRAVKFTLGIEKMEEKSKKEAENKDFR
jgi:hypothetical protein